MDHFNPKTIWLKELNNWCSAPPEYGMAPTLPLLARQEIHLYLYACQEEYGILMIRTVTIC